MKKFMMTTAIVAVTSFGAIAQTTDTTTTGTTTTGQAASGQMQNQQQQQQSEMVPAFLVSDFTGKDLYTLDIDEARALRDQGASASRWDRAQMRWESSATFTAARDRWQDVGDINDIVLTSDGQVRGVLIDVGGFLGIGARTVLVDIENLYFVSEDEGAEDLDDFFVVAAMTEDELEALPEWDDEQLRLGYEPRGYDFDRQQEPGATMGQGGTTAQPPAATEQQAATQDQAATQAPAAGQEPAATTQEQPATTQDQAATDQERTDGMARTQAPEGYAMMDENERTADNLLGASVYGAENEEIGSVEDLVLGDDTNVTHMVVDIGGFLGMGSHRVALSADEVDIFWNDEDGDVRVQVPMTQEQLEALPEHDG